MEKLYYQLIAAKAIRNSVTKRALRLLMLAFTLSSMSYITMAQVVVGPAGGGTNICSSTAVGGSAPSCTALGPISITETLNTDFAPGTDGITINPPAGWQFCIAFTPVVTIAGGGDITAVPAFTLTSGALTFSSISVLGNTNHDAITITGLQVQALSPFSVPGNIYASVSTGITGITIGTGIGATNFGNLSLIPTTITGPSSVCIGSCITVSSGPVGGVWSTTTPGVATVTGSGTTATVCGVGSGTAIVKYTVGGCSSTYPGNIVVNPNPAPITFSIPGFPGHMCAWYDTILATGGISGLSYGIFNSSGLTVSNSIGTGTGKVFAHAPGVDTLWYTFPTGCQTKTTITVDPLPAPIQTPPYQVCQGSCVTLTDASVPGTWTSVTPAVGSISTSGVFCGITPGTTLIEYTIPGGFSTGCITDTTMTVLALPAPIVMVDEIDEICSGASFRLADATPGGTWLSVSGGIVTVFPTTGDTTTVAGVAGMSGTSLISYTAPDGCAQTITVTVDPLPDSITGPHVVCVGDSIVLSDGTAGGKWTSGTTSVATIDSISGSLVGVGAGVTIVTYTILPGHCVSTYSVTVNPLPGLITGPDSICVGAVSSLIDTSTGGKWYTVSGGLILHVDSTGAFPTVLMAGISIGVDSVYYFITATGCRTGYVVTVNALPPPITGPTNICLGDTVLYTDLSTTGGTWIIDSSILTHVGIYPDSARVAGATASFTTVTYTNPSGCSVSLTVTVNPIPGPIFSDTSVCEGQSTVLHNIVASGTWSVWSTTTATINPLTGVITGVSTGTTLVTYTGPGGCYVIMPFYVWPLPPISGINHLCQGDSVMLYCPTAGTWVSGDPSKATIGPNSDSAILHGISGGVVTISYITMNGCITTYSVTINPVSNILISSPGPVICIGDSFLVSDLTLGGTWSSSDPSVATVTPISPTLAWVHGVGTMLATIIYTLPTTCNAAVQITVNPLPGPIYGRDSVCMGDTIHLTDSNTLITGVWSVTNGNATINPLTGVLTGLHAGWDTVVYTYPGSGCQRFFRVKINVLYPITVSGLSRVCVHSDLFVSDTTPGTGVWNVLHHNLDSITNIAPIIPSGSSATDSGMVAGIDTITYHIAATGCTAYLTVTINPLPTITGPDSVCAGTTIVDTGHAPGGTWLLYNGHAFLTPTGIDSTVYIHGLTVGTDTLKYTSNVGCVITRSIVVDSTPTPIVSSSTICLWRTEIISDATIGGTWTAVNGHIIVTGSGSTDTLHAMSLGVDTIIYTLPTHSCSSQIVVTVVPIPTITLSQTHPSWICIGASSTITAGGAGPGGTYTWSPSFGLSATTGTTVVASPTLTTTYTVTGTSQYGCDSTDTITVLVDSTFIHMKVLGRDSICRGESDTLMASGRDSTYFKWNPVASLNCTICDTTIATPDFTTTYTGIAIDDMGCKDSVVFKITVNPLPLVEVTPNPAVLCYGTPMQFHATTTNTDNSTTKFSWSPNLFISNDSVYNPIINDTSNLVYIVTATSIFGCHDSVKVKVSVLDTNVNSIIKDTNICLGSSAQLYAYSHSVTSNLDIPVFTWSPDTAISALNIWDPIVSPTVTTTYKVHVVENACFDTTMKVTVFVQPYPGINLYPFAETIVAGTPTQLFASVDNTPVLFYAWQPSSTLSCDSCQNPVATPTVNTTYTVTVSSIYHCVDQDTIRLNMICDNSQIFIPNTFTPNGDGINDRFYVSGKGISVVTLLQVYNRWGELVFEADNVPANNAGFGWDGTFKGLVLEPDVFVYIVHAQCELGGPIFKYQGNISIVR